MAHKIGSLVSFSILFCAFVFSSNANAGFDIGKLASDCESQSFEQFYCFGRLSGIFDMMDLNAKKLISTSDRRTKILSVCNVNGGQSNAALRQIFLNWAKAHPERWSEPDQVGVVTALSETWPCR